jgi:hypothetical protein
MQTNANLIRKLIGRLFKSQMNAARQLGVNPRTVRYWCSCGTASHVEKALRGLDTGDLTLDEARRFIKEKRSRRVLPAQNASFKSMIERRL